MILPVRDLSTIRVPAYLGSPCYPLIRGLGPREFNLETLEPWRHPLQFQGPVPYQTVWQHIERDPEMLKRCLGLIHGYAISELPPRIFHRCFPNHVTIPLWRDAHKPTGLEVRVPVLCITGHVVGMPWVWVVVEDGRPPTHEKLGPTGITYLLPKETKVG